MPYLSTWTFNHSSKCQTKKIRYDEDKKLIGLLAVILSAGGIFFACNEFDDVPEPHPGTITFSAKGGQQIIKMRSDKGNDIRGQWFLETIKSHPDDSIKCIYDTLADGRTRIRLADLTLTSLTDKETIIVELGANNTTKKRSFSVYGHSRLGFGIAINQSPKDTLTTTPKQ